ncbi:hypothetical protein MTR67_006956 [Solanum verrucosum]|uniref:Uncharacterized protein n=1 Tax=Solanum verrucosum TaxID=315347 RepID=A0AAF0Q463_SOLVR|nr:hypothetical protein MTR67_006956 [Solanum verrucosum]
MAKMKGQQHKEHKAGLRQTMTKKHKPSKQNKKQITRAQGMDITPLQAQYMNPPLNEPPDKRTEMCQMNKGPLIDEYAIDNSEDELDVDNHLLRTLMRMMRLKRMNNTLLVTLATLNCKTNSPSPLWSDHCPLLLELNAKEQEHIKYFKFLNCWADHNKFLDIVKTCWERNVEGNNMWKFHQKLKRLSNTLSSWSRKEFGDIFGKVREYEEKEKKKMFIHKLIGDDGEWLQGEDNIAKAACDHFHNIFTGDKGLFAESTGNQMATMPCTAKGHGWLRPAIGVVELSQCIIQLLCNLLPLILGGKWAAGLNLGRSSRQDGTVRKGGEQELTYLIMSSSQGTGAIHKNSMVLKLHYMKV